MSRRTILLLIAALVAAFAAITVRNRLMQAPVVQAVGQPVAAPRLLIAKRDLVVGTFVQGAQDLDWAVAPEGLTQQPVHAPEAGPGSEVQAPHNNYLFEGSVKLTDFNGAVVRRSLHAGDPVPQLALMKSGEGGFMSAVLESGMRAVSFAVNVTSGNAGFVSPGDHVDLIVTHRVKTLQGGNGSDEVVVSETFTHDVRVVAVDQMLDNPENKAILAKTITVEVTPRQAEQVAVAAEIGKISIALCSLPGADKNDKKQDAAKADADDEAKPVDANTKALGDLFNADTHPVVKAVDLDLGGHKGALVPRVMVIRGDKSENVDFYQGKQ